MGRRGACRFVDELAMGGLAPTRGPPDLAVTTSVSWTTIRVPFRAVVWSPAESAITIATRVTRLTGFCRLGQLRKGTDHGSHRTGHVARKIRNLLR
jgi:hypothetical protein